LIWFNLGMRLFTLRAMLMLGGLSLLAFLPGEGRGGEPPRLVTAPHQQRVQLSGFRPLPRWETTWWVSATAVAAGSGICRLHYTARFADSPDARPAVGSFDVRSNDTGEVSGRIDVRCASAADYDRALVIRLQAEACDGTTSRWSEDELSVLRLMEESESSAHPSPLPEGQARTVETVTTEAGADTPIGDVRAVLDASARALGAKQATGIRIVETVGDRVRFAADAEVEAIAPTAVPKATPVAAATERVLGEIVMRLPRR